MPPLITTSSPTSTLSPNTATVGLPSQLENLPKPKAAEIKGNLTLTQLAHKQNVKVSDQAGIKTRLACVKLALDSAASQRLLLKQVPKKMRALFLDWKYHRSQQQKWSIH